MADLQTPVNSALLNLLTPQNASDYENTLFQSMQGDIENQAKNQALGLIENTFGRGMGQGVPTSPGGLGLSSVARDLLANNEIARQTALMKARSIAASDARSAQLAAGGQAAGQLQREQQSNQFEKTLAQQRSQAQQQMIGGGLGGLASAGVGAYGQRAGADRIAAMMGRGPTVAGAPGGSATSYQTPQGSYEQTGGPQGPGPSPTVAPFTVENPVSASPTGLSDLGSVGGADFANFNMPNLTNYYDPSQFMTGFDLLSAYNPSDYYSSGFGGLY